MKIKVTVSTPRVTSGYSRIVKVDDEDWQQMSQEEKEEFIWQEVTDTISYDWEVV